MLHADQPPEELTRYTGFLLNYLGERSRRRFFAALEPLGLDPREFGVLTVIMNRPGRTQQELAALARIDPSSMVALLDGLEERGLAERRVDPKDRRRRAVHLTAKGKSEMKAVQRRAEQTAEEFLAPLTGVERETLNALLRKLAGLAP